MTHETYLAAHAIEQQLDRLPTALSRFSDDPGGLDLAAVSALCLSVHNDLDGLALSASLLNTILEWGGEASTDLKNRLAAAQTALTNDRNAL